MKNLFQALVIFYLFLFPAMLKAQSWEVGLKGGVSGYFGDINPVQIYRPRDLGGAVFIKTNIDPYWSFGLSYYRAQVSGNDNYSRNAAQRRRNLNFYSTVSEWSLFSEFNFLNYVPSMTRTRLTPYIFAGVGVAFFDPKTTYQDETYRLRSLMTEGQDEPYKKYALTIPYGAGLKYNISGKWTLGGEAGYRTIFTDYLDDVSGRYPNTTGWDPTRANLSDRSGTTAATKHYRPGDQRGDFRPRDNYFFVGFTISYTFLAYKCPKVF